MKKTSVANLIIVIGLLVLCVMTLVAVYATAPDAVLLLEEGFDQLDGNKWRHQVADCEEDGGQFQYVTADEENRLIADGVLHIYPNITSVHLKTKREADASGNCTSCSGSANTTVECNSSLISTKVESRDAFNASRGRVEIRARICCGGQILFGIGITDDGNDSHPGDGFGSLVESRNATVGNTSRIRILFQSDSNKTIITSAIPDNDFHIYEVSWDEERVVLEVDKKKVDEARMEERAEGEDISPGTVKLDSGPISKPFFLSIGVGFEDSHLENFPKRSNNNRSSDSATDSNRNNRSVLEVDYIKMLKILN